MRPSERADAQANGALALAKELGRNPREVAADVLAAADLAGVAVAEIAGPGFINLTLEPAFLAGLLADVAGRRPPRRRRRPTHPKRVVVDYSAPNVAKEMHIGHLRTTVIGDALVRMLDFVGHDVVRENHIGDWGRPFGMLIEHLVDLGGIERDGHARLGDLDAFYKEATTKFDRRRRLPGARPGPASSRSSRATTRRWRCGERWSPRAPTTGTTSTPSSACCSPTTTSPARAATRR